MNDGLKEPHVADKYGTTHHLPLPKTVVDFKSFCGGAYLYFITDPKEVHERQNTKNIIIK